ncbi:MAG: ABC transporter substrate-binding protein, partial [Betaproteobacteria bacterium]|nr:ABC transporter substrate-binding protein [Betaproteobacteria bacterium]
MSAFNDPFDPHVKLARGCACGRHSTQAEHDAVAGSADSELLGSRAVESAVMRALFPQDEARRGFLKAVGAATALAAVGSLFPLAAAKEAFAQRKGGIEKTKLKVGFIPITCATPIIMAHPMGFYAKHGLDVEVVKTAG